MEETRPERVKTSRGRYLARVSVLFVQFLFDRLADRLRVMFREGDLFLGIGLFLLGLLNFNAGRYCDGNTGEYLSCTRPAVYYYFDAIDIALIVLGAFLMLYWIVKRRG